MPQVFDEIPYRDVQLWDNQTVKLRHNLAGLDLFSDESLARLIEPMDPTRIDITTMGEDVSTWGHVDRAGIAGEKVLEAVRRGRLWINMMGMERAHPRFRRLLDQMFAELEAALPDFATFKHKMCLLISSPQALAPAQGGFVELTFPEPGHYPFVSHVMLDAERGAHGTLAVTP
ncbi:hypothetical protein [Pseudonocardia acaciae]|uniref:hypothetical protein n=1 Tax=Pseudonocardia acaciae TaxID=551276 RepID=UPI00048B6D56|nr:hypothetical protein [Pseudonocardia acaciae]